MYARAWPLASRTQYPEGVASTVHGAGNRRFESDIARFWHENVSGTMAFEHRFDDFASQHLTTCAECPFVQGVGVQMKLVMLVLCVVLAGCARSSVIPMSADTFQIMSGAAPICGATGAQMVAARQAAVETIRRGYDRFMVVNGGYQNNVGVVGYTPVTANSYGSASVYGNTAYGSSTTTYSGGQPIIAGTHNQALVVKMFNSGDPAGHNAIDARGQLGPEWQKAIQSDSATCLGN
jgi:hypothetical protein